ncbi:MAG: hypothetical protein HZB68_04150 [Candidatus Aenigmarchaeota archaeon]|nr:hypothetical protein [Candidatus Aenigmarchaeota archaeon]
MSQFRKATVGESFSINVEGKFYGELARASFGPIYDDDMIDIEKVGVSPIKSKGLSIGDPCLYEYKIMPKKKGCSEIKFGTRYCSEFNENSSIEIYAE